MRFWFKFIFFFVLSAPAFSAGPPKLCPRLLAEILPLTGANDPHVALVFDLFSHAFEDVNSVDMFGVDWGHFTKPFDLNRGGTLVAYSQGEVVGFANVTRVTDSSGDSLRVNLIHVLPVYQNRNVGRQLVEKIDSLAEAEGISLLTAQSNNTFPEWSQFLEATGFRAIGAGVWQRQVVQPIDLRRVMRMSEGDRSRFLEGEIERDIKQPH